MKFIRLKSQHQTQYDDLPGYLRNIVPFGPDVPFCVSATQHDISSPQSLVHRLVLDTGSVEEMVDGLSISVSAHTEVSIVDMQPFSVVRQDFDIGTGDANPTELGIISAVTQSAKSVEHQTLPVIDGNDTQFGHVAETVLLSQDFEAHDSDDSSVHCNVVVASFEPHHQPVSPASNKNMLIRCDSLLSSQIVTKKCCIANKSSQPSVIAENIDAYNPYEFPRGWEATFVTQSLKNARRNASLLLSKASNYPVRFLIGGIYNTKLRVPDWFLIVQHNRTVGELKHWHQYHRLRIPGKSLLKDLTFAFVCGVVATPPLHSSRADEVRRLRGRQDLSHTISYSSKYQAFASTPDAFGVVSVYSPATLKIVRTFSVHKEAHRDAGKKSVFVESKLIGSEERGIHSRPVPAPQFHRFTESEARDLAERALSDPYTCLAYDKSATKAGMNNGLFASYRDSTTIEQYISAHSQYRIKHELTASPREDLVYDLRRGIASVHLKRKAK